jgi:hypothetical protein
MSDPHQQRQHQETPPEKERERRIRERAYFIWEHEGRPEGRHLEHWRRARVHIEEEDGTGAWSDRGC